MAAVQQMSEVTASRNKGLRAADETAEDLEANTSTEDGSQESEEETSSDHLETLEGGKKSESRHNCFCCRLPRKWICAIGLFLGIVILAFGISVIVLWPKDPTWHLTKLEFKNPDSLKTLMTVMTPEGLAKMGNTTIPPVTITAEVLLKNPNDLGAYADAAKIEVFFQDKLMAVGHGEPVKVPGNSEVVTKADVTIHLTVDLAQKLVGDLFSNNFAVKVRVTANSEVQAPLGIKLNCGVRCSITADVLKIVGASPQSLISMKQCHYDYHL
eukprot:TRINITY_DN66425_c0_g1_i1.p1 TRINITY_DN66425_c0_g1~~TRINITY_DN66425_c0_g1_i1.p1  ORF type:complete len:270 (-),score=38.60 TRINITY_DN66425_c0_g1_i1:411-1220(-)